MKISELIHKLQVVLEIEGDLEVYDFDVNPIGQVRVDNDEPISVILEKENG